MKMQHILSRFPSPKNLLKIGLLSGIGFAGLSTTNSDNFEIVKNLEIFANIYKEIHSYYVDDVQTEKIMRTGINAMLRSLDPYTTYISPEEVERFRSTISGKYGGVGATLTMYKEKAIISDIYENSPAAKAGLQIGDILLSANGENLTGKTAQDISKNLRGNPSSTVQLTVQRQGQSKPINLNITRQVISVENVPIAQMVDKNTAYLVLNNFTEHAGNNLSQALQNLKRDNEVKNIILDLRNNPGGLLNEAVNVTNLFVPKSQLIVQLKGKDLDTQQNYSTLNYPVDTTSNLVILIDERSASASEIVAGAIQDLDRGIVLGSRSFGKGLVQTTKDISYDAKLKITTARYYIPSGRCIQATSYENGKHITIADSLRTAFKTKNGRTVLDGGGIMPDITVGDLEYKKVLDSLRKDMLIFDFASEYKSKHNTIASAKDFKLTDKDFEDFMKFLKERNFNYHTESDALLADLEKKAKDDNYYEPLKADIEKMKIALSDEKRQMLLKYKPQLLQQLQSNIVQRYYFEKGVLENNLYNDFVIAEAKEVLKNESNYKKLLNKK